MPVLAEENGKRGMQGGTGKTLGGGVQVSSWGKLRRGVQFTGEISSIIRERHRGNDIWFPGIKNYRSKSLHGKIL